MLTLQDTDREIVVNLIATNIVNSANPVPALQAIIGPKALDIPSQDSPRKWAEVAVRFCQDQDWDEQGKHPLLKLLAFGKALNERIPRIIQALESLPRPEDPFTARVLDNGMAFLGRQTLRQAVRELLRPDGPCVLRIRGPAKAGKSYSLKVPPIPPPAEEALEARSGGESRTGDHGFNNRPNPRSAHGCRPLHSPQPRPGNSAAIGPDSGRLGAQPRDAGIGAVVVRA